MSEHTKKTYYPFMLPYFFSNATMHECVVLELPWVGELTNSSRIVRLCPVVLTQVSLFVRNKNAYVSC